MGCERHRRIQQITINIPLFVFLFVALPQLLSITALAATQDDPYVGHIEREKASPSQQSTTVVRNLKLHSRCSGRHVSVKGRTVQAKASQTNKYAWLRVETYSFESRVRIRSAATHSFLCFNDKGRLTVKNAAKGPRCLFTERHAPNDYTEFRSVANPRWYLGFNKEGKRLAGDQWTKAKDQTAALKCYQFIKTDFAPYLHTPTLGRQGADSAGGGAKGVRPPAPLPAGSSSSGDWYTALNRRSGGGGKQRRSSDGRKGRVMEDRKNKPPK